MRRAVLTAGTTTGRGDLAEAGFSPRPCSPLPQGAHRPPSPSGAAADSGLGTQGQGRPRGILAHRLLEAGGHPQWTRPELSARARAAPLWGAVATPTTWPRGPLGLRLSASWG